MVTRVPLLGLAIGDALGMPFEMRKPDDPFFAAWNGKTYLGSQFHKLEPGQYTDDTQMSIALGKSILEAGKYEPAVAAKHYLEWFRNGPRGIGGTIKEAMLKLGEGLEWNEAGVKRQGYCGNGTAMRVSPLALAYRNAPIDMVMFADLDAQITHKHVDNEAGEGSVALTWAINLLLGGVQPCDILQDIVSTPELMAIDTRVYSKLVLARDLLKQNVHPAKAMRRLGNGGDVAETVSSAIYCASFFDQDFARAVEVSVRAGGDTDTRTSMVGAMVASHLGIEDIPDDLILGLEKPHELLDLNDALLAMIPE